MPRNKKFTDNKHSLAIKVISHLSMYKIRYIIIGILVFFMLGTIIYYRTINYNIDLVYLWCDGDDPKFKRQKDFWLAKEGKETLRQATDESRFVQVDELKYSLRSVEKYLPWIHHIYIVTYNQVPKWLDTNNPKITIVDHSEIIKKEYLPVFNSNAIETAIYKIPGLSEHFLYACDDMFVNHPLDRDFFFQDGKPIVRLNKINLRPTQQYYEQLLYVILLAEQYLGKNIYPFHHRRLAPHHNIDAYLKSDYQNTVENFTKEYTRTLTHRFRKVTSIQRYLVSIWSYVKGHVKLKINLLHKSEDKKGGYTADSLFVSNYRRNDFRQIELYDPGLFCINDGELSKHEDRVYTKEFLEKLFPLKSKFEL